MTRPPVPPPDGIDVNVNTIANPANDSVEAMSSPTALFPINTSNIDSFLSVRPPKNCYRYVAVALSIMSKLQAVES